MHQMRSIDFMEICNLDSKHDLFTPTCQVFFLLNLHAE
jgi:hypothetical protein